MARVVELQLHRENTRRLRESRSRAEVSLPCHGIVSYRPCFSRLEIGQLIIPVFFSNFKYGRWGVIRSTQEKEKVHRIRFVKLIIISFNLIR